MKIVKRVYRKHFDQISEWAVYFEHIMDVSTFATYNYYNSNLSISYLLMDDEENVVGAYLLAKNQINHFYKGVEKFENLNGVEGILLFIKEEYRGLGWGEKLKDKPKEMGFDYVWGRQHKKLNNLHHWLKRRELICEMEREYVTAEIFIRENEISKKNVV